MGCDIHTRSEKKINGEWKNIGYSPFEWRSYAIFGFLADVRNYSGVKPLSAPRGIPSDSPVLDDNDYYHSGSWFLLNELNNFNYDDLTEDRRCTINGDGGSTCSIGEGEKMTYREFLGEVFFNDINELNKIGAERIVFAFDN